MTFGEWFDFRHILERNETVDDAACSACGKAREYYSSCIDPDSKLESLGGEPLLNLLSNFYWNITDFDGGTQLENWNLQVLCIV